MTNPNKKVHSKFRNSEIVAFILHIAGLLTLPMKKI